MELKYLLALISLWVCCNFSGVYVYGHDCDDGGSTSELSLCEVFQQLRDLVPADSINRLVCSHMESDTRFRKAVQYILSKEFKRTTAKIDSSGTFQSLLKQFTAAGVDTSEINSVGKIFDCVLIPLLEGCSSEFRSSSRSVSGAEVRSLDTFAQEVARLIPTEELKEALETQLAENEEFAEFYEVVRDPEFRSKVMKGFHNRDISRPIKTLRHHQIDLAKLTEYAFNLLYLGPEI